MSIPDRGHDGEAASTDFSAVEDLVEEGSTDYSSDHETHLRDWVW